MSSPSARNKKIPLPANRLPPVVPTNGQQAQPATHIAIPVETANAILGQIQSLSLIGDAFRNGLPITVGKKTAPVQP